MPIAAASNVGKEQSHIAAGYSKLQITTLDNDILTHWRLALLELVQKHIRTRDMLELISKLLGFLELWMELPQKAVSQLTCY